MTETVFPGMIDSEKRKIIVHCEPCKASHLYWRLDDERMIPIRNRHAIYQPWPPVFDTPHGACPVRRVRITEAWGGYAFGGFGVFDLPEDSPFRDREMQVVEPEGNYLLSAMLRIWNKPSDFPFGITLTTAQANQAGKNAARILLHMMKREFPTTQTYIRYDALPDHADSLIFSDEEPEASVIRRIESLRLAAVGVAGRNHHDELITEDQITRTVNDFLDHEKSDV